MVLDKKNGWLVVMLLIVEGELIGVEQKEAPVFTDYNWRDYVNNQ